MRAPKDPDKHEYRPKSFLVCPGISRIKAESLRSRNIIAIPATGAEFFASMAAIDSFRTLDAISIRKRVYPFQFQGDRALERAVSAYFDQIIPNALPEIRQTGSSRFFLGAEPTWNDISERRDGDRCVTDELVKMLASPASDFRCFALTGPAGSGKTTTVMRAALRLAELGNEVYFSRNVNRIDLNGILAYLEGRETTDIPITIFIDVVSHHLQSLLAVKQRMMQANNVTLVVVDRTNRYASKCQRMEEIGPQIVPMPDLSETDVVSILQRLEQFGFLGVLREKSEPDRVRLFMQRASRQLLVALREATSGKDFDLILKGEYEELVPAARLA